MNLEMNDAVRILTEIRAEVRKVFLGQDEILDQVLAALLASGHVLIEGLPGLGKTLMVRALAKTFQGRNQRVQFTPDLMPSDLVGHSVFDVPSGKFSTRRGPVFTHLLIADEINRAPAKTQSALLEVMQEYQVTLDGESHALERPFLVLATQNPFEHEGTYPLPDAQLDRFLLKVLIGYPALEDEIAMVGRNLESKRGESLDIEAVGTVTDSATLQALQDLCGSVRAAPSVIQYAVRIIDATRRHHSVQVGAGPRASLALIRLARAKALLDGRDFITPSDVKAMTVPVLRHRLVMDPEWELSGGTVEESIGAVLESVEAPRE